MIDLSSGKAFDLEPLPYHADIRSHLEKDHPETWSWFASGSFRQEAVENVRLELLKSAYRLEREPHATLYERVDRARSALGLEKPVVVFQDQQNAELNAWVAYLPDEIDIVLSGPILERLDGDELTALFGHELAHYHLYDRWDRAYLVSADILTTMANDRQAEASHEESDRLYHLMTEIYADRGALLACESLATTVSMLVKVTTGLAEVSADSYLRQSSEILEHGLEGASGLTHPETYLRVAALDLWHDASPEDHPAVETKIRRMIEGPLKLDALDLLGQRRWEDLTRRFLARFLCSDGLRSETHIAHACLFFFDFEASENVPGDDDDTLFEALREGLGEGGMGDYLCYLVLDFAALESGLEEETLAAGFTLLEPLGLADRLEEVAARELPLEPKHVTTIRSNAPQIVRSAGDST